MVGVGVGGGYLVREGMGERLLKPMHAAASNPHLCLPPHS